MSENDSENVMQESVSHGNGFLIGRINELKPNEDFEAWLERFELYADINGLESNKVSLFLTLVGSNTYETIRSLCTPRVPKDVPYKELVKMLKEYIKPKPSIRAERSVFRSRLQKDGESVMQYISQLKTLSQTCNFGKNLEENLVEQINHGLANKTLKKRLYEEKELSFKKCVEIVSSWEATELSLATSKGVLAGNSTVWKIDKQKKE